MLPAWLQSVKVLPTVFDDSLSYYEVLCKLAYKIEELEKPKYKHNITIICGGNEGYAYLKFIIETNDNTSFTLETLANYLTEKNITNIGLSYPVTGSYYYDPYGTTIPVIGIYSSGDTPYFVYYTGESGVEAESIQREVTIEDTIV